MGSSSLTCWVAVVRVLVGGESVRYRRLQEFDVEHGQAHTQAQARDEAGAQQIVPHNAALHHFIQLWKVLSDVTQKAGM